MTAAAADYDGDLFHDSLDRLISSASASASASSDDDDPNYVSATSPNPRLPVAAYSVWISEPSSVEERRRRLLLRMGLAGDVRSSLSSSSGESSCSGSQGYFDPDYENQSNNNNNNNTQCIRSDNNSFFSVGFSEKIHSIDSLSNSHIQFLDIPKEVRLGEKSSLNIQENHLSVCTIKNLDTGKEFIVNEVREDGKCNKLKEVGTGRQLTMEEFDIFVGQSPIVQELMRRQNVENENNGILENIANGTKKKKGSLFRSLRNMMMGQKKRESSDERETSSGQRSSSATDYNQDSSHFNGPERVRTKLYGKSWKELSGLYKSQEIKAHNGSIWSIKFSLDGKYLASAGEDCVIHVWKVVKSEKRDDFLIDGNLGFLFLANGSPEPKITLSPKKKRRGRLSISRKSVSFEHILVPETVFALSEKPLCSFFGHLDDVLDLSWSNSQHLLSSSMDKTVRLWHLSSNSCLKIFSHSDYVTCIQFNPVDDKYFISGSLDAKVRIWSIPDRQVVDWNDLNEMVTAVCYTPDGQGALVGSHKGRCHVFNTSENKLEQKGQINLQNKKKRSHLKKITGFQFAPGSTSKVLITSADSRIRVIDDVDLVHKFKGFRNTNSQISASLTANGKYAICASEDSHVYIWRHHINSRPNRTKGVTITISFENFHCQDVSVAIPWPGMTECASFEETNYHNINNDNNNKNKNSPLTSDSPLHGTISSARNSYIFDKISATWPEEKLINMNNRDPHVSVDFNNDVTSQSMSALGMVIVTAGLRGEIRTFQNFGMPIRV